MCEWLAGLEDQEPTPIRHPLTVAMTAMTGYQYTLIK
jgi:hypothetical protein